MGSRVTAGGLLAPTNNSILTSALSNDFVLYTSKPYQSTVFGCYETSSMYLKISSNGHIGVNTPNPSYHLHVDGNTYISSNVIINSNLHVKKNTDVYGQLLCHNQVICSSNVTLLGTMNMSNANGSSYITSYGGNIGINTPIPTYTLHVSGVIFTEGYISSLSDARFKTNIQPLREPLSTVCMMNGYTYNRVDDAMDETHIGLIAQEILPIVPELVNYDDKNDMYSVKYANAIPLLIEAIKELNIKVQTLEEKLK